MELTPESLTLIGAGVLALSGAMKTFVEAVSEHIGIRYEPIHKMEMADARHYAVVQDELAKEGVASTHSEVARRRSVPSPHKSRRCYRRGCKHASRSYFCKTSQHRLACEILHK